MFIDFKKTKLGETPSHCVDAPRVIDDMSAYEILCPVNKLTGLRENPLRLLKTLANDPAKSRLLDSVLAEVKQMDSVGASDEDMLNMMSQRFETGTPYENEVFRSRLESISDALFTTLQVGSKKVENKSDKIVFDSSDSAASEK